MPTPSIQTLVTDAQQILNLDSISAVRSVVAVALANANTGTPLNPNLTTQQLWNEFYQVVNKPKSDIESIIANQLMKFLFAPPAPGGAGANQQVIFNDGGVLAGDPQFLWNKTTNLLTVTGSATITGDLTVDTSTLKVDSANNRVGIGTASPAATAEVNGGNLYINGNAGGYGLYSFYDRTNYANIFSLIRHNGDSGGTQIYNINSSTDRSFNFYSGTTLAGASLLMTLNSTGLGVGTSPTQKFVCAGPRSYFAGGGAVYGIGIGFNTTRTAADHVFFLGATDSATPDLVFSGASGAALMRLDAAGNLGIGVQPSAGGSIYYKTLEIGKAGCGLFAATTPLSSSEFTYLSGNGVLAYNAGPEWKYGNNGAAAIYGIEDGVHKWYNATTGTAGVVFTPTQAMTLDASGNLLVGTTSALIASTRRLSVVGTVAAALQSTGAATVEAVNVWHTATTGNNIFIDFDTEASVTSRGSISYNRSGGLVAYNTTSDYRAKDIIGPVSNSGSVIDSLKVYIGKMKGASVERPMLVAHEAQTVAPYAVTGEKDAVDVDGNPRYQQMDVSSFVPLLIAEIQSLRTRVQTLEAR